MTKKPKHFRRLFDSFWLPLVYDLWVSVATAGNTKGLRENILQFLPPNPKVIVDLATGTGENALLLEKRFPKARVFASDMSKGMLEKAKEKARKLALDIEFSLQDASRTNYPSSFADAVCISFALHDMPKEQRKEVMAEAHRLLKPRGVFLIYDYHMPKNWAARIPLFVQFLLVENRDAWDMLGDNLQERLLATGFQKTQQKTFHKGLSQIVAAEKC